MLREGNAQHSLTSLVVPAHLDDWSVMSARQSAGEERQGEAHPGWRAAVPRRPRPTSVRATGPETGLQGPVSPGRTPPPSTTAPPPRPGSGPPQVAPVAAAGSVLTSGQVHSVRAGYGLPVGK